jgi:KDO2-lipid IV(A) lauroyltransferase
MTAVLRIFVGVFSRVPLRLGWWFSWGIAWLWWTVLPIRKSVAVSGFHQTFPELPVGRNLRRMTAELIMGYLEFFRESRKPCVQLTIENRELIRRQVESGGGAILIGGHFGSWDLVGPMVCRQLSLPATVVVKTPGVKAAADFVERQRLAFGMELLPPRDSFDAIISALGKGRLVTFLLDQRYKRGFPIEFFGRPAWTTPVVAVAVERNGAPVYGLCYWREGIGRHRARFSGPLPMIGDIERDTRTIQEFYETTIRERPHSWLWLHERWKKP